MIKNIVFDLGNVCLFDKPKSILANLKINDDLKDIIEKEYFGDFGDLDLGYITLEEHFNKKLGSVTINDELKEILTYYYRYRKFNDEILDLMKKLYDNNYKIYILSDNNKETYDYLKDVPVFNIVSGWIMSCDYHLSKKEEDIYLKLFEEYKLNPSECYFIDDSKSNIETAKKLGMNGYVLNLSVDGIDGLLDDLKKNNINY